MLDIYILNHFPKFRFSIREGMPFLHVTDYLLEVFFQRFKPVDISVLCSLYVCRARLSWTA